MENRLEKIKQFDDSKLIDLVKNYRQYGYDDELRNSAIRLLEERGISAETLKLTGNFENSLFREAEGLYLLFKLYSRRAFIWYGLFLLLKIITPLFLLNSDFYYLFLLIATWVPAVVYLYFLVRSYLVRYRFYKMIGKERSAGDVLIYLFLGMPIYILLYFYYNRQMDEEIKLIN